MADTWRVERHVDTAQALHDLEPDADPAASVWLCEPTRPAVVLGSAQRDLRLDAVAVSDAGLDVAVRRSGGGAVLVDPLDTVWIDFVVPRGHPLWVDDVGRAMHWVGETWARALAASDVEAVVHRGGLDQRRWGRTVCAAGLGPGEVVDPDGRKLVGISQRRTRSVARFQSILAIEESGVDLAAVLGLADADAVSLRRELAAVAAPVRLARTVVIDAVVDALPR